MPYRIDHSDELLATVLLGGFGRAKANRFLNGRRQIVHLKIEVHLFLLIAGFFRPDGGQIVEVTLHKVNNHPIVGD